MEEADARSRRRLTVGLCLLAAMFEGVDLQSMGIAAPKLSKELMLAPAQFGLAASMSLGGLLVGAAIGGRLSDLWGRKRVLVGAMIALGVFSLGTTLVRGWYDLLGVRVLVGLGLGAAFPTLIAIVTDALTGPSRAGPLSLMYTGLPLGTVIGTLLVLSTGHAFQWRWIFYIGGFGPLLLAPLLFFLLPETVVPKATTLDRHLAPVTQVLFAQGRARPTFLLWTAFFFTLLVIYLLTNWMNGLMIARGFRPVEATMILLAFGVGSALGSLGLGAIMDAGHRRFTAIFTYAGVAISLIGLSLLRDFAPLIVAGFGAGFFAVGAQLVNYAMAPGFYPADVRGTGVGWTVAVGRLGSFFGPLIGGMLLQQGFKAATVLMMFVPCLAIAAIASTMMLWTGDKVGSASSIADEPLGATTGRRRRSW